MVSIMLPDSDVICRLTRIASRKYGLSPQGSTRVDCAFHGDFRLALSELSSFLSVVAMPSSRIFGGTMFP